MPCGAMGVLNCYLWGLPMEEHLLGLKKRWWLFRLRSMKLQHSLLANDRTTELTQFSGYSQCNKLQQILRGQQGQKIPVCYFWVVFTVSGLHREGQELLTAVLHLPKWAAGLRKLLWWGGGPKGVPAGWAPPAKTKQRSEFLVMLREGLPAF